MTILTFACGHSQHASCEREDKRCMCGCHEWNKPKTPSLATQYREEAHAAVKDFDRKPDASNTAAAVKALSLYLGVLSIG